MYIGLHVQCPLYSCPILNYLEFSRQILQKYSNTKCHENQSGGSRVVPCGQTDGWLYMTKLIVAFRNFANVPKTMSGKLLDFSLSRIMKEMGVITTIFSSIIITIIIILRCYYRYLGYAG